MDKNKIIDAELDIINSAKALSAHIEAVSDNKNMVVCCLVSDPVTGISSFQVAGNTVPLISSLKAAMDGCPPFKKAMRTAVLWTLKTGDDISSFKDTLSVVEKQLSSEAGERPFVKNIR